MYLNFVGFCGFTWICQLWDCTKYHTNWQPKTCIWWLYFYSWSPKGDLRIFSILSPVIPDNAHDLLRSFLQNNFLTSKIVFHLLHVTDHAYWIKEGNAKRQKKYSEYIYSCIICLQICAWYHTKGMFNYALLAGAPNKNIVQKHLNIALLNIF